MHKNLNIVLYTYTQYTRCWLWIWLLILPFHSTPGPDILRSGDDLGNPGTPDQWWQISRLLEDYFRPCSHPQSEGTETPTGHMNALDIC